MEAVAQRQKVPKEEAAVEAIGAPKERLGDQRVAVGYKERRTKDDVILETPKGRTF
jgi:hypothetical protein